MIVAPDMVAVITGAGGGIGLALARALAAKGARIALLDIDGEAAEAGAAGVREAGGDAIGIACDIADHASVDAAADRVARDYGGVDLLCCNAGVAKNGGMDAIDAADWRWIMDVNLFGTVDTISTFLPLIRGRQGGHILITASIASFMSGPGVEAYAASKHGLLALGEGFAEQLAPQGIGVSLLCPSFVRTGIAESGVHRQPRYGDTPPPSTDVDDPLVQGVRAGLEPAIVAARAIEGIAAGERYIFTHPEMRPMIEARFDAIRAALDSADRSVALGGS